MSWSASAGPAPVADVATALEGATTSPPELDAGPAEQFQAAKDAAVAIAASGCVGGEGREVYISLSGHANPGHEPAEGWANDCVTVSLTQRSA